jgi:GGDEF domain-containing protein
VLAEAASRVREVVRTADIPCRVGGDEFAAGRLHVSAGLTALKAEDDSISLFERADKALYRAKEAGKSQSVTANSGA